MKFKTTAIAAACLALAPVALAQQGTTDTARSSMSDTTRGASSMMSADTIRQVQQQLADRGYNPGPVDGVMGPNTRSALRNFRQAQGMSGSELDQSTLSALGIDASGAAMSGSSRSGMTDSGTTGSRTTGSDTTSSGATGMTGSGTLGSGTTGPTGAAGTTAPNSGSPTDINNRDRTTGSTTRSGAPGTTGSGTAPR